MDTNINTEPGNIPENANMTSETMFHIRTDHLVDGAAQLIVEYKGEMCNGTKICVDFGTSWTALSRTALFRNNLHRISETLGRPVPSLVVSRQRGGTWIHPVVAQLAIKTLSEEAGIKFNNAIIQLLNGKTTECGLLKETIRLQKVEVDEKQGILSEFNELERMYDVKVLENKELDQRYWNLLFKYEDLRKEKTALEDKHKELQRKYDQTAEMWDNQCKLKERYREWENDWRTVYEYVLKTYHVALPEKKYRAIDKVVSKKFKEKHDNNSKHLWLQKDKYYNLVQDSIPRFADTVKPPLPQGPRGAKIASPINLHTFRREDWHLIEDEIEMFRYELENSMKIV